MASGILPLIPVDIVGYCEPFVGGGGVTVKLLDRMVGSGIDITLNDADARVASWWNVVADANPESFHGLLSMIAETTPTPEMFYIVQDWGLNPLMVRLIRAFAGIFLNRCAFSGVLSGGPIGGPNQTSKYTVDCRWNPKALRANHLAVRKALAGHDVTVSAVDFREVIKGCPDSFVYADPPYRAKGKMLYPSPFTPDDHEDLATLLLAREDWLLSYDDHPWVRERYDGCVIEPISTYYTVKAGRSANVHGTELLIRPSC